MKVEIEFTEPLLGTLAGDPKVATEFILSKCADGPKEDEAESLPEEAIEKASTIFSRDADGNPILWDYQIKGFFKAACRAMIDSGAFTKEELKKFLLTTYMHKRTIDTLVFVKPRRLVLQCPDGVDVQNLEFLERPLRAETMRGERIALARSQVCPVGTKLVFEIKTLNDKIDKFIERWLDYGELYGLGQWRNSGMGRFKWKKLDN